MSYVVLLFLVLWLSIGLADQAFYFSQFTRWGLLLINIPFLLYLFYKGFYKPFTNWWNLKERYDLTEIALQLRRFFPELEDTFINIYQLLSFSNKFSIFLLLIFLFIIIID